MPEFNPFCKQRLTTLPSNHIPRQWTVAKSNRWSGQLVSRRAEKGEENKTRIKEGETQFLDFHPSSSALSYRVDRVAVNQLIVELTPSRNNHSHSQLAPVHRCTCILIHVTAPWQKPEPLQTRGRACSSGCLHAQAVEVTLQFLQHPLPPKMFAAKIPIFFTQLFWLLSWQ